MAQLPVREMVLYKHGVGFFVREGSFTGESTDMTFRQDEINDVLKSLAVFDRSGGQILGIHYQTPMDKDARLASSSIRLSDEASLGDLLSRLRGRAVKVEVEYPNGQSTFFTGRMLGTDDLTDEQNYMRAKQKRVSLVVEEAGIVSFDWTALRGLQILDAQSAHDLTYFLDTSMSEDIRRTVNVRLSEGDHQLVVYYVAPSPTWRVSYRLVAESDENEESGKALLQGWGLFDNRLEEDLEDVKVTLVAGQPISFIYDLYESRIPTRPTVKDQSRVAPGPIEFEGAYDELADMDDEPEERARGVSLAKRAMSAPAAPAPALYSMPAAAPKPQSLAAFGGSTPAAAEAKDTGEFFQYAVTSPVSVKRGESALVPIIGSEIKYQRELLYNAAKLPTHPVVALRFDNSTGLTLERGPVTVVEDWDYKGEAIIPFTKDGSGVYVPFAVELGVRITEQYGRDTQTTGLSIRDAYFVFEQYETTRTTYLIENTTAKPVTVMIEAARLSSDWSLYETKIPDVETAAERRWKVNLSARAKTEFIVQHRRKIFRSEQVRNLDYRQLQDYTAKGWLDNAIRRELGKMLDEVNAVQQARARIQSLDAETQKLHKQQEQLRANLGALQPNGQEAALRKRMLGQLETSQDRLEAIENEVTKLNKLIADGERKINEIVAALG